MLLDGRLRKVSYMTDYLHHKNDEKQFNLSCGMAGGLSGFFIFYDFIGGCFIFPKVVNFIKLSSQRRIFS